MLLLAPYKSSFLCVENRLDGRGESWRSVNAKVDLCVVVRVVGATQRNAQGMNSGMWLLFGESKTCTIYISLTEYGIWH